LSYYVARQTVNAVQWREDNLDEMITLLKDVVENDADGPCVYVDEVEPYFLQSLGHQPGYFMLKFYSGDDMEVDPGQWVIVYEDDEIEIMNDEQFNRMFRKKN